MLLFLLDQFVQVIQLILVEANKFDQHKLGFHVLYPILLFYA